MPKLRSGIVDPGSSVAIIGGREKQYPEGMALILIGITDRIAALGIALPSQFRGKSRDTRRGISVQSPSYCIAFIISAQPEYAVIQRTGAERGNSPLLDESSRHWDKDIQAAAGIVDLRCFAPTESYLVMVYNHSNNVIRELADYNLA